MKPVGKCWVMTRASSQWQGNDCPSLWVFHSVLNVRSGWPPACAVETDADHSVISSSASAIPGAISRSPATSVAAQTAIVSRARLTMVVPPRVSPVLPVRLPVSLWLFLGIAQVAAGAEVGSRRQLRGAFRGAPRPVALVRRFAGRQRRRRFEAAVGPGVVELDDVAVVILLDQRVEG